MTTLHRRLVLTAAAASLLPSAAVHASPDRVAALVADFVGKAPLADGRIKLDLPVLVENGNAVSMTLGVEAPAGTVREIAVFADGNPLPEGLRLRLGPASGPLRVETRIRLATSQTVTAIARMADGTCWRDRVELLVTLAACIE
jgi:sulfur-oxidizing protein SoxY